MQILITILILTILSIIPISLLDYLVFTKLLKNNKVKWYAYIPATTLEAFCFAVGLYVGGVLL